MYEIQWPEQSRKVPFSWVLELESADDGTPVAASDYNVVIEIFPLPPYPAGRVGGGWWYDSEVLTSPLLSATFGNGWVVELTPGVVQFTFLASSLQALTHAEVGVRGRIESVTTPDTDSVDLFYGRLPLL